jgi:hypothetical protein
MDKCKSNHFISVDSETGIYWDGERQLRAQPQVNVAINQATAETYVNRGRALFNFAVMKLIRTTASCLVQIHHHLRLRIAQSK